MSTKFQPRNKNLSQLKIVNSKQVWSKNAKGKYTYNKKYDVYGKVEKGYSAFVVNTNNSGNNPKFVEDTFRLPKNLKTNIVKTFANKPTTRVVYLVRDKK